MPDKKKPPNDKPEEDNSENSTDHEDDPVVDGPRLGPGDPVRIHEDFVRHHTEGGARATPEAYERAVEQWRRLPGAVVNSPRRIRPPTEPPEELPDDQNGESAQKEQPDDPENESGDEGKPS